MIIRKDKDLHSLIRELRAELAQNRTDIQRLQKLIERTVVHQQPINPTA